MGKLDELCEECGLYREFPAECPNMNPRGASEPWLHVVGMAPGTQEDREGRPFVGPSGDELTFALKKAGANVKHCRFDNVVRCLPKNNKFSRKQLALCSQRAREEIQLSKPRALLVLGNEAIEGIWHTQKGGQVSQRRGSVVPYKLDDGTWIPAVVTNHPSNIIRGVPYEIEDVWFEDVALAWDQAVKTAEGEETDVSFMHERGLLREPERHVLTTFAELREFFPRLADAEAAAWDYETAGFKPWNVRDEKNRLPVDARIYSAAFAFGDSVYGIPLYPDNWNEKGRMKIGEAVTKWLFDTPGKKIAHNLKFELQWSLVEWVAPVLGMEPRDALRELRKQLRRFDDTLLLCWLDDERTKQSGLKRAGWRIFGDEDWSTEINVKKIWTQEPTKVVRYNSDDAWQTLKLREWADEFVLNDDTLAHVYNSVTLPAAFAMTDLELRGMLIDEDERERLRDQYSGKVKDMLAEVCDIVSESGYVDQKIEEKGEDWNPASPEQLARYFTHGCRYRMLRRTTKGWSTDEETLKYLVEEYRDPVAEIMLDLRGLSKMDGTYISGLDKHIYEDGYLHGSYNLAGPVTGRTSSSDPNMQNFPKRDKEQKQIRRMIIPPPGFKLCSFDYGQVEARLFGVITGDPVFCEELFDPDTDIHLSNSVELFGEDLAADHRDNVKNGTFAMFYGAGDQKVADTVEAPIEDVRALRRLIFGKYRYIEPWQKQVNNFYNRYGYVESLFGRRRRAPMSYNEILNQTNQSTASDMTLTSQNVLWVSTDVGLMIHDDLSFLIRDDENLSDELLYIAEVMLSVPWLLMHDSPFTREWVPMQVECSVGDNWCDLSEVFKVNSLEMGQRNMRETLDRGHEILAELDCEDLLLAA